MNLYGENMQIGDFRLSDYGLVLASFDSGSNGVEETGMKYETVEEQLGNRSIPLYLGRKCSEKLRPTAVLIKNPELVQAEHFTRQECREILRQLTGFYGYRQLKIYSKEYEENLYFNVRITNVQYQKFSGRIIGIILEMECDSAFAWSEIIQGSYELSAGDTLTLYNHSDDLYGYVMPTVTITALSPVEELIITNVSDNDRSCILDKLEENEVITMDSQKELLTSSITDKHILNYFNMHFIRLVSGINRLSVNADVKLHIAFRLPRKVGFV